MWRAVRSDLDGTADPPRDLRWLYLLRPPRCEERGADRLPVPSAPRKCACLTPVKPHVPVMLLTMLGLRIGDVLPSSAVSRHTDVSTELFRLVAAGAVGIDTLEGVVTRS